MMVRLKGSDTGPSPQPLRPYTVMLWFPGATPVKSTVMSAVMSPAVMVAPAGRDHTYSSAVATAVEEKLMPLSSWQMGEVPETTGLSVGAPVLMVIFRLGEVLIQPNELVSVTDTVPAPAASQSTVMELVPAPVATEPPVTFQL